MSFLFANLRDVDLKFGMITELVPTEEDNLSVLPDIKLKSPIITLRHMRGAY